MEVVGGEVALDGGGVGVGEDCMAELLRVAGNGYGEVAGAGSAGGGGARGGAVGGGEGGGEGERGGGGLAAVEPGELAAGVEHHGGGLRRRAGGDGDGEGDVMVEGELVWGAREGLGGDLLGFEGEDQR